MKKLLEDIFMERVLGRHCLKTTFCGQYFEDVRKQRYEDSIMKTLLEDNII